MDKKIQGLDDDASYDVMDNEGKSIGAITGADIKTAWKNTDWSVTTERADMKGREGAGAITEFTPSVGGGGSADVTIRGYEVASTRVLPAGADIGRTVKHEFGHAIQGVTGLGAQQGTNLASQGHTSGYIGAAHEQQNQFIMRAYTGAIGIPTIPKPYIFPEN